jgi:hypothetical protein
MPSKPMKLDPDTVLSIFRYILSITKIENLFSHLFLTEKFSSEHQLTMAISGYYYAVLKCAVETNFGGED